MCIIICNLYERVQQYLHKWLKEVISNLQATLGQLMTSLFPAYQVWAMMWGKINANILLKGMEVGIATLECNQASHQKNAK